MTQLDLSILDWIQAQLRCGFLDAVTPWVTALGEYGALWIAVAVILLVRKKTRSQGVAVAAALALDLLLCNILIKPLAARPRPFTLNPGVELLIPAPSDFSFPSGHTAASFAAAAALFFSKSRGWVPALIVSLAIAFTRLYLYVHYPSDVLCGALLGILCGAAGAFFAKKVRGARETRKN